ncbi:hypothetical protein LTR28_009062, partial [Elasticomyces elasticus]
MRSSSASTTSLPTPTHRPRPAGRPPPFSPPAPPPTRWRPSKPQLYLLSIGSLSVFAISAYGANLYTTASHSPATATTPAATEPQHDVSARYDDTASSFDAEVGASELLMGVRGLRKKLARRCRGDVLEASAGTGRNLGYYVFDARGAKGVRSLTLVDLSGPMCEVARRKWEAVKGKVEARMGGGQVVRFVRASALERMSGPPTPGGEEDGGERKKKRGYDTIVQTMGLCSTPEPARLLRNLALHLDASNAEARILLLEHGRSYYDWVNRILDAGAARHADKHG